MITIPSTNQEVTEEYYESFLARVDSRILVQRGTCWLWQGTTITGGYGVVGGKNGRMVAVHRLIYATHIGPIPPGMYVCHKCDVPGCCNPAHLFLGTAKDNAADKVAKGRQSRKSTPGEASGKAKVTEAQVREIRRLYEAGWSRDALGRIFGVTYGCIDPILKRRTWRHVT